MLTIQLSKYQAIVTRGAILDRLPEYRDYLNAAPGFARGMIQDHVAAMEAALTTINDALEAVGVSRDEVTL